MRIDSVRITNYGGLRLAEMRGLAQHAVITVTGRNGTGKSLFLEAIAQVLSQRWSPGSRIGPWGDKAEIRLSVILDEMEQKAVSGWLASRNIFTEKAVGKFGDIGMKLTRDSYEMLGDDWAIAILSDENFKEVHPFIHVSFLPAVRAVRGEYHGLDLDSLDPERIRQSRGEGIERALSRGEPFVTPSVSSQLTALDYLDLLAARDNVPSGELERVVEVFETATGKKIIRPTSEVTAPSRFEAELGNGSRHSVNDLSSGERAMLSLLFYARRVATQGGVLLIDEPEQHLHPTLVAPLMASMVGLAPEAQIFVVTHAAGAMAAANQSGIVVLEQPTGSEMSQLRMAESRGSFNALDELGISASELLGVDGVVIVEGPEDEKFLSTVFPLLAGRLRIVQAGGVKQALKYCDTLANLETGLDWLCVVDRDLRPAAEVEELQSRYPGLFVWSGRDFESLFLRGTLIAAAYKVTSKVLEASNIERELREIADSLRGEVIATRTTERAVSDARDAQSAGKGSAVGKSWLEAQSDVFRRAAEFYDSLKQEVVAEVDAKWASNWRELVDPKIVLQKVVAKHRYFSKAAPINSVIMQILADDPDPPEDLKTLDTRLRQLMRHNAPCDVNPAT